MEEEKTKIDNTNQDPAGAAGEEANKAEAQEHPKLFTQEEVNEIIRKRLAKEKAKAVPAPAADADLEKRAARLNCKEFLLDNGLSTDLLDVIDTTDFEAFKEKAAKVQSMKAASTAGRSFINDRGEVRHMLKDDQHIKDAFSIKAKHKPKEYNPYG